MSGDARVDDPSPRVARRHPDVTQVEIIGGVEAGPVALSDHDPSWAGRYAEHAARIRSALGSTLVDVEHIGSTAVPGLAAKPIIDILATVRDITAEEDYLPGLIGAGYVLRVREPGHRLVRTPRRDVHVHLLEEHDPAAEDYLVLRDRLRSSGPDRRRYEDLKRELAAHDWADRNDYAAAKGPVIEAIKTRARSTPRSRPRP